MPKHVPPPGTYPNARADPPGPASADLAPNHHPCRADRPAPHRDRHSPDIGQQQPTYPRPIASDDAQHFARRRSSDSLRHDRLPGKRVARPRGDDAGLHNPTYSRIATAWKRPRRLTHVAYGVRSQTSTKMVGASATSARTRRVQNRFQRVREGGDETPRRACDLGAAARALQQGSAAQFRRVTVGQRVAKSGSPALDEGQRHCAWRKMSGGPGGADHSRRLHAAPTHFQGAAHRALGDVPSPDKPSRERGSPNLVQHKAATPPSLRSGAATAAHGHGFGSQEQRGGKDILQLAHVNFGFPCSRVMLETQLCDTLPSGGEGGDRGREGEQQIVGPVPDHQDYRRRLVQLSPWYSDRRGPAMLAGRAAAAWPHHISGRHASQDGFAAAGDIGDTSASRPPRKPGRGKARGHGGHRDLHNSRPAPVTTSRTNVDAPVGGPDIPRAEGARACRRLGDGGDRGGDHDVVNGRPLGLQLVTGTSGMRSSSTSRDPRQHRRPPFTAPGRARKPRTPSAQYSQCRGPPMTPERRQQRDTNPADLPQGQPTEELYSRHDRIARKAAGIAMVAPALRDPQTVCQQ